MMLKNYLQVEVIKKRTKYHPVIIIISIYFWHRAVQSRLRLRTRTALILPVIFGFPTYENSWTNI